MQVNTQANQKEIIVPYNTLAPELQAIIGNPKRMKLSYPVEAFNKILSKSGFQNSIIMARTFRGIAEINAAAFILLSLTPKSQALNLRLTSGAMLALRIAVVKIVQRKHEELLSTIKKVGIIKQGAHAKYSAFADINELEKTHPIFFVDAKGNLHFLKETKTECARSIFQKKWAGRIGLNMWRWRVYLHEPQPTQSLNAWAKETAQAWAKKFVQRNPKLIARTKQMNPLRLMNRKRSKLKNI